MTYYAVQIQAEITPAKTEDPDVVSHVADRIVRCLKLLTVHARHRLVDVNIVDFTFDVEPAASPLDAVMAGATMLRSAAHHAEVATPGWPTGTDADTFLSERAVSAFERPVEPELLAP